MPKTHGSFNVPAGTRLSLTCFGACDPGQTTQHRLALARITRFLPLVSVFSERLSEGFRQWNEYASSRNTCYMTLFMTAQVHCTSIHKYILTQLDIDKYNSHKSKNSSRNLGGVSGRTLLLESSSFKFGGSLARNASFWKAHSLKFGGSLALYAYFGYFFPILWKSHAKRSW